MARLTIKGGSITDCDKGISVPAGSNLEANIEGVHVSNVGTFFEERGAPIPFDGPPEEIARILREYLAAKPATEAAAAEVLEKAGISRWARAKDAASRVGAWLIANPDKVQGWVEFVESQAAGK